MDTRKPWEVEYCMRAKFAASYIDMLDATGTRRTLLETAYNCDIEEFCQRQMREALTKCEKLISENGPLCTYARTVAAGWLESVRQRV